MVDSPPPALTPLVTGTTMLRGWTLAHVWQALVNHPRQSIDMGADSDSGDRTIVASMIGGGTREHSVGVRSCGGRTGVACWLPGCDAVP